MTATRHPRTSARTARCSRRPRSWSFRGPTTTSGAARETRRRSSARSPTGFSIAREGAGVARGVTVRPRVHLGLAPRAPYPDERQHDERATEEPRPHDEPEDEGDRAYRNPEQRVPPPRSPGERCFPAPRPGERRMHRSLLAGRAAGGGALPEHDQEPDPQRGDRDERQRRVHQRLFRRDDRVHPPRLPPTPRSFYSGTGLAVAAWRRWRNPKWRSIPARSP